MCMSALIKHWTSLAGAGLAPVSPAEWGGSFSTASSIFVRARYGLVFFFCFLPFWSWLELRIHQNRSAHSPKKFKACVCSACGTCASDEETGGLRELQECFGLREKIAFFAFFFKVHYNEMDSCCIRSQKRFLTWYSGTSFSSLGQP